MFVRTKCWEHLQLLLHMSDKNIPFAEHLHAHLGSKTVPTVPRHETDVKTCHFRALFLPTFLYRPRVLQSTSFHNSMGTIDGNRGVTMPKFGFSIQTPKASSATGSYILSDECVFFVQRPLSNIE